jgi:hypothetical protein
MSKSNIPTPEDLKKADVALDNFDIEIQRSSAFNQPLTRPERALLKTFFLYLELRSRSEP